MIFTVPMWGSEVANYKTEIHLTNTTSVVMRPCNVNSIEHERVTLLREAYATAFGRGCQVIMQTAGRHEIPRVIGW